MKQSVLVIIIDTEGKMCLQHRDVHAPKNPNTWGLWGGSVEHSETPIEAAQRELKEELGIDVDKGQLKLFKIYKDIDRIRYVFCMTDDGRTNYRLQEGDGLKHISVSELKNFDVNDISLKILSDFFNVDNTE